MSENHPVWVRKRLADFILLQRGFDLPHRQRLPGPYQVLSSGGASGSHDEAPVKGPGFVVGRATNIGRPTWSDEDYWPLNTVLFAKEFMGNDPKFAFYWFLARDLTAYNSGSVQPMLNRNYIANIPIDVPPIEEQRAIAATLGALDDKIESNGRAAEQLLHLAQLHFEASVAATDPHMIPLEELASITRGRSYKSVELQDSTTALVTLKSIDRNGGYKQDGLKPYIGEYKPEQVVQPGEVVVAQTDLTQGAEVVGRGVRVPHEPSFETLVASLDLAIVRPTGSMPVEYLWGLLTSESFRQHCRNHVTGTTVLHLAKDAIPTWLAPLIPPAEQEAFAAIARPLLERMDALNRESGVLVSLRDALLPELVSGRMRVQEEAA